jgi:undecaprenyl-diphosphatase
MVIAGTLPAAFAGLFYEKIIEAAFSSPRLVALALLVTGGILFLTRLRGENRRGEGALRLSDALLIGLFQALALVPGISRSGATIAAALFMGIERETAARFSFLLAVPAILGAFVLKTARFSPDASAGLGAILFGTAVSAVVGAIALGWLLHFVRRGNLHIFAYYCWALGASVILFL